MTDLHVILYAQGALRLTDHGPRGGGVVMMNANTGKQVDMPYKDANTGPVLVKMLDTELRAMDRCRYEPEVIFERFASIYGQRGAR